MDGCQPLREGGICTVNECSPSQGRDPEPYMRVRIRVKDGVRDGVGALSRCLVDGRQGSPTEAVHPAWVFNTDYE